VWSIVVAFFVRVANVLVDRCLFICSDLPNAEKRGTLWFQLPHRAAPFQLPSPNGKTALEEMVSKKKNHQSHVLWTRCKLTTP
jgi:hypothetical protein